MRSSVLLTPINYVLELFGFGTHYEYYDKQFKGKEEAVTVFCRRNLYTKQEWYYRSDNTFWTPLEGLFNSYWVKTDLLENVN